MATVIDPAFWRRFSIAVRMEEEVKAIREQSTTTITTTTTTTTSSKNGTKTEFQRPARLEHSDSWLDRHQKKRRRALMIGWDIVLVTLVLVLAILLVCLWLVKLGPFSQQVRESQSHDDHSR